MTILPTTSDLDASDAICAAARQNLYREETFLDSKRYVIRFKTEDGSGCLVPGGLFADAESSWVCHARTELPLRNQQLRESNAREVALAAEVERLKGQVSALRESLTETRSVTATLFEIIAGSGKCSEIMGDYRLDDFKGFGVRAGKVLDETKPPNPAATA